MESASAGKHEQRIRAEAAGQMRRRLLHAVCQRLRAAPVAPVGFDRVAQIAGVSRPTVSLLVGSRAGLFDTLGRDRLEGDTFSQVLDTAAAPDEAPSSPGITPNRPSYSGSTGAKRGSVTPAVRASKRTARGIPTCRA